MIIFCIGQIMWFLHPHMAGNAGDVMLLSVRIMMEEIVRYYEKRETSKVRVV